MQSIDLIKAEKSLTLSDIKDVEKKLKTNLPDDFIEHYLEHNGGSPKKCIAKNNEIGHVEIRDFIPIKYCAKFKNSPDFTLEGRIKEEWEKLEVPRKLLPFAMDFGGEYFCLNLEDKQIYYYIRDNWNDSLGQEENFLANSTLIAPSFADFIDCLQEPETSQALEQSIESKKSAKKKTPPALKLSSKEKKLSKKEIETAAANLGITLPEEFISFYLKNNGGAPNKPIIQDYHEEIDYIEISHFMPIKYREEFEHNPEYTLEGQAKKEWENSETPKYLLPFAMDWGANYICLNLNDHKIYYFVRDTWLDNLSVEDNFIVNSTPICPSFAYLIEHLEESEDD